MNDPDTRALAIFERLLAAPAESRSGMLQAECGNDTALYAFVASLLRTHEWVEDQVAQKESVAATTLGRPSQLEPGTVLADRYTVRQLIGSGGMGEVYEATDERLERQVAIKVLSHDFITDEAMQVRFEREMKSLAALAHPNVMSIHDLGNHGHLTFAVMELVGGDSLRTRIDRQQGMQWQQAIQLAAGIAAGLSAAHAINIMHRDIKPENVIVTESGVVKVLDFGLARPVATQPDQVVTETAMTPGTIPYMSPEQAEADILTCATDVFSLGTVLCELITGSNPFRGKSVLDTLRRIADPVPPPFSGQQLPAPLIALMQQLLSRDPAKRPTAAETVSRLHNLSAAAANRTNVGSDLPYVAAATTSTEVATEPFQVPETQFAPCGDVHIAFQVFGNGPLNLVIAPGFISNVDNSWENAELTDWLQRFGRVARVAVFDKRGTGLSDRVGSMPSLEERIEDVCAVMDAVGFDRTMVLGISEGGSLAAMFAATYPHRCQGLILHGSFAKFSSWFETAEALEGLFGYIRSSWGSGTSLPGFAPSVAEDPEFAAWWGKFERRGANPGAAIDLMRMNSQIDISDILPAIQAPTLCIRRDQDVLIDPAAAEFLVDNIPNARLFSSASSDHVPWVGEPVRNEVREVVAFMRRVDENEQSGFVPETVLATVIAIGGFESSERVGSVVAEYQGTDLVGDGRFLHSTFNGPARAVHCALAIAEAEPAACIGLHIGEVRSDGLSVSGPAVSKARDISGVAAAGDVIVSRTITDLVAGSGLAFEGIGDHALPDTPPGWCLYRAKREGLATSGSPESPEA